jgi:hypothetical protein
MTFEKNLSFDFNNVGKILHYFRHIADIQQLMFVHIIPRHLNWNALFDLFR